MAQALTAQFASGRQVAQPSQFQVTQGPGMSGGQVADYLRGNALNIGQQINGQNANMINIDPASDLRARERFTEAMTQSTYDADQAMQRQKMDLEGRMAMADAQNALTKELGYARMKSAEDMQKESIASTEKISFAQLSEKEKSRIENARQFNSQQEWIKESKGLDLSEAEAQRVWNAVENEKNRTFQGEQTEKKLESQERVAFAQIDNQFKIAGMEDKTRNRIADMANKIDEAKVGIMEAEIGLGYDQLAEKKRQFDDNIDLQYAELDAEMLKADDANKRMLEVAKIQLEGTKYNVDKSFELKSLERQDEANRAANIQPVVDDMLAKVIAWKSGGQTEREDELTAAFIMSNASRIKGIDITTLYKPNGNPNPVAINKAKEAFYSNPENASLRDSMNQFVTSGIQATNTQMNELERMAFQYKGKYAPSTTPPGNAITAPQGGSEGFTPQLPPGFKGMR